MVSEERRSHARGDILFKVKFNIITPEEYENLKTSEGEIFSPNRKDPIIDIIDTDNRDTDSTPNTCLIDLLLHMDEKLDQILAFVSKDGSDKGHLNQAKGLNISGSGMNIIVDKPIEPGKIIHTNFVLSRFPMVFIDTFGEVVRAIPVDKEGKTMYHLGIKFLDLNLSDRERIITCVFQRQRETIRKRKSE